MTHTSGYNSILVYKKSMVMIATVFTLLIVIVVNIEGVLGSSSETRLCPPGYVVNEDGFCDPKTTSSIPDIASELKTENGSKLENTSQSPSSVSCPGFDISLLPRDMQSKYGQQCGYNLIVQLNDWASDAAVIDIETANGYQDSVSLNEGLPGTIFHTFRIPPNQGDSVTVCTDPEGSVGSCQTFTTDAVDSVVFIEWGNHGSLGSNVISPIGPSISYDPVKKEYIKPNR